MQKLLRQRESMCTVSRGEGPASHRVKETVRNAAFCPEASVNVATMTSDQMLRETRTPDDV